MIHEPTVFTSRASSGNNGAARPGGFRKMGRASRDIPTYEIKTNFIDPHFPI